MAAFAVIVCSKCREHAQIIEIPGPKKTRCQKCGSNLEIRKLRLFHRSEDLQEAVAARTVLQAKLHGQEKDGMSLFSESSEPVKAISIRETGLFDVSLKDFTDKREFTVQKLNKNLLIIDLLRSNGGKMDTDSLKEIAKEHGIQEQKFEQILDGLTRAGEIYEPSTGMVCLT
ncbi:DUF5817 domain-containing protein [Methanolobus halotolerans]|uniref:DUF5817 domain-containing protein n=1 Tax=Methanolobus halotolerans TaxID=2052935 RepID=A0A4E0Q1Z8_9EURY|nr:hypothetical protein [Methanolobus halotolerans]TGC11125.1 hypothetical protein CUN85_03000 [Methanolobus halotolerans]